MSALLDAWQGALAAEHEAVFGYGVLGPRLPADRRAAARRDQAAHAAARDHTDAALRAAHRSPVAALVDYPALYPVADVAAAQRLAVRLEEHCAAAWRYLYLRAASTDTSQAGSLRTDAQGALSASAVRAARWRLLVTPSAATVAFPGT